MRCDCFENSGFDSFYGCYLDSSFQIFFDDFEDFKKNTKNKTFLITVEFILDSLFNTSTDFGGFRLLIFLLIGILSGLMLDLLL